MSLKKRIALVLFCTVLALVLILPPIYMVRTANHTCAGECCFVCLFIARAQTMLRTLAAILPAVLVLLCLMFSRRTEPAVCGRYLPVHTTLVSWKIRLNN